MDFLQLVLQDTPLKRLLEHDLPTNLGIAYQELSSDIKNFLAAVSDLDLGGLV